MLDEAANRQLLLRRQREQALDRCFVEAWNAALPDSGAARTAVDYHRFLLAAWETFDARHTIGEIDPIDDYQQSFDALLQSANEIAVRTAPRNDATAD